MASTKRRSDIRLPVVDEYGFYEIRMDSIGGLGAHLAGQILGEAAVIKMGLNALHFSSYGSEKKGSPVKSFVRFAAPDQMIRSCSPIEQPHLVAVFHDALLRTPGGLAGLRKKGSLIINTRKRLDNLKKYGLPEDCHIYLIDALTIAIEEKSRVNTAMLGAITKASGFLDPDAVLAAISETFTKKHASATGPNERTFKRGLAELKLVAEPSAAFLKDKEEHASLRAVPKFGYLTAPIGGLIFEAGNSVLKDISASREGFLPVFDPEKCVHCGMCDLVCPDHCLVWKEEVAAGGEGEARVWLEGIDYNYCKGCLRCVESCPSGALTKGAETEGYADAHRTILFPQTKKKKGK